MQTQLYCHLKVTSETGNVMSTRNAKIRIKCAGCRIIPGYRRDYQQLFNASKKFATTFK